MLSDLSFLSDPSCLSDLSEPSILSHLSELSQKGGKLEKNGKNGKLGKLGKIGKHGKMGKIGKKGNIGENRNSEPSCGFLDILADGDEQYPSEDAGRNVVQGYPASRLEPRTMQATVAAVNAALKMLVGRSRLEPIREMSGKPKAFCPAAAAPAVAATAAASATCIL